jgi:hypothetical protein
VLILSVSCSFAFFLSLLYHFDWLCCFSCFLFAFAVFLFLDDLLKLFLAFFGLLAVLHETLDSNFKLCVFIVNSRLIKGEIEKPSGQFMV